MLPFFNQSNRWRITGQLLNAAVVLISAYDLIQHPEDAFKAAPGLASHLLNIYAQRGDDLLILDGITSCLALERSYMIYHNITFDNAASVLQLVDIASHLLSVGILFLTEGLASNKEHVSLSPSKH